MDLTKLSALEIATAIKVGETTSQAVTRALLERIEDREPDVDAWEYLDPDAAISAAKKLDDNPSDGLIHGVPVGVKDIIDTKGIPTTHGSPIHKENRPCVDAPCVSLVRDAGGLIMGKNGNLRICRTAAWKDQNPHNPAHSPAGSSSGSRRGRDRLYGPRRIWHANRRDLSCGPAHSVAVSGTNRPMAITTRSACMTTRGASTRWE